MEDERKKGGREFKMFNQISSKLIKEGFEEGGIVGGEIYQSVLEADRIASKYKCHKLVRKEMIKLAQEGRWTRGYGINEPFKSVGLISMATQLAETWDVPDEFYSSSFIPVSPIDEKGGGNVTEYDSGIVNDSIEDNEMKCTKEESLMEAKKIIDDGKYHILVQKEMINIVESGRWTKGTERNDKIKNHGLIIMAIMGANTWDVPNEFLRDQLKASKEPFINNGEQGIILKSRWIAKKDTNKRIFFKKKHKKHLGYKV